MLWWVAVVDPAGTPSYGQVQWLFLPVLAPCPLHCSSTLHSIFEPFKGRGRRAGKTALLLLTSARAELPLCYPALLYHCDSWALAPPPVKVGLQLMGKYPAGAAFPSPYLPCWGAGHWLHFCHAAVKNRRALSGCRSIMPIGGASLSSVLSLRCSGKSLWPLCPYRCLKPFILPCKQHPRGSTLLAGYGNMVPAQTEPPKPLLFILKWQRE